VFRYNPETSAIHVNCNNNITDDKSTVEVRPEEHQGKRILFFSSFLEFF
jgi:hypothetical protein